MPVRPKLGRLFTSLVAGITLSLLFSFVPLYAADSMDQEISGGHFYRQANGFGGRGDQGFLIWDEPGGPAFYSQFRELGGVDALGYPASRRFEQDGYIYLITQGALLQYHPALQEVLLANTFEILERAGLNDLLYARGIPMSIVDDGSNGDFEIAKQTRLDWLTNDAIRHHYLGAGGEEAAMRLYGLPMSKPQTFGPFITQRFQRIALQYWMVDVPGIAQQGDITTILGGDLLKEFNLLPFEAKLPHMSYERPAPVEFNTGQDEKRFGFVIAEGTSEFAGSSHARVHNIVTAASKIHGYVIQPGETFSFLKVLGPITRKTGFHTSLVIWGDKTIWGVGGGVCQVSTTVFRAAFWAGLPIAERHPHTYRVKYYEQDGSPPGFDATIYSPWLDLKFVNDTEYPVLIQARVDEQAKKLTITLRGGDHDRTVEMLPTIKKNVEAPGPPLPDLLDPSLPSGARLQVEWAVDGMETGIIRQIVQGDSTRTDEFWSEFTPWRERWAVGTRRY